MTAPIQFNDGAGYERYMGVWSQLVGDAFLDWLAPPSGARWLDVGCGNGAFTSKIVERCAPASIDGVDPSDAQLTFARARFASDTIRFRVGDAMALPYADRAFDAAVMPLVIFFVPQPSVGVAEMVRVVDVGGTVSAYAWDIEGGGFPYALLQSELRALDVPVPTAPREDAARLDNLQSMWLNAGLTDVETTALTVERTFAGFAEYWETIFFGPSVGPSLRALSPSQRHSLESRLREHLPSDAAGRIRYGARAHAVKGRVAATTRP